jgi:hypothetical protein
MDPGAGRGGRAHSLGSVYGDKTGWGELSPSPEADITRLVHPQPTLDEPTES